MIVENKDALDKQLQIRPVSKRPITRRAQIEMLMDRYYRDPDNGILYLDLVDVLTARFKAARLAKQIEEKFSGDLDMIEVLRTIGWDFDI